MCQMLAKQRSLLLADSRLQFAAGQLCVTLVDGVGSQGQISLATVSAKQPCTCFTVVIDAFLAITQ
jgi:hypothetical protein